MNTQNTQYKASADTPSIGFIGAGNMASALIGGLIKQRFTAIYASDPYPEALSALQKKFPDNPIHASSQHDDIAQYADVIVLAVKPQVLKEACQQLKLHLGERKPLIISIAAGITLAHLEQWLNASLPILRCMPNTPALVGLGATGLYANPSTNETQKQLGERIINAVGISVWLKTEAEIDAVTALSGSGPAYYFLMIEAMIKAGEKLGLSNSTAQQLALQTALGSSNMAANSDDDPAELRRKVTSPGGTTEQAILSFKNNGFERIVEEALQAAAERSVTLSEELSS